MNPFKRGFGHSNWSNAWQDQDPKTYLPGHVLTEAIPDKTHDEAPDDQHRTPDLAEFDRTGDSQRDSSLLRLPIEIRRRIYDLLWEDAGLTRHIYIKHGRYTHTTCITDHDAEDERQVELWKIYPKPPSTKLYLDDPVWSRRLLSSWVNHWRCEEAATAVAEATPVPTPFLALLLCCKRMYVDCRKPLYERLSFTFHRVETALDFFCVRRSAITSEIKSLQLALQISAQAGPGGWSDVPPHLPWHGIADSYLSLKDCLPELESLHHLSIWLDAASPNARDNLMVYGDLFKVDQRLVPIVRLSLPVDEFWGERYLSRLVLPYVVLRGMTELRQEPTIAPEITFSHRYGPGPLYQVVRHGCHAKGHSHRPRRGYLYNSTHSSHWRSRILPW